MSPDQISFGEQTASKPNSTDATTNEAAPAPSEKKNRFPIAIAIVAIVAAIAIIATGIVIGEQNKHNQGNNKGGDTSQDKSETPEPTIETEFAAKDRLTKKEYTIDDLNAGITLDSEGNYTFTASSYVTFASTSKNVPNLLVAVSVMHENLSPVTVKIYIEPSNINDLDQKCTNTKGCTSDYVEGAKTLFLSTTSDKEISYDYYSKKDGSLQKYSTTLAKSANIKEATVRNILIKAAMSMSGKSNHPYVYDLAAMLKLPNQNHVKSHKDIDAVKSDLIQIALTNESGDKTYILVYYKPVQGVAVSEISKDPKVGSFTHDKQPYFRFYDGDDVLDVTIAINTKKGNSFVSDLKKAQEIIDKIDE